MLSFKRSNQALVVEAMEKVGGGGGRQTEGYGNLTIPGKPGSNFTTPS